MSSTTGVGVAEDPSAAIDRLNNGRSPPIGVRKRSVNSQVSQVAERTITDLSSTTPTSPLKPHRRVKAREYLPLITRPTTDAVAVAPRVQTRSSRDDHINGGGDSTQTINNTNQNNKNKENNMISIGKGVTGFHQPCVEKKSTTKISKGSEERMSLPKVKDISGRALPVPRNSQESAAPPTSRSVEIAPKSGWDNASPELQKTILNQLQSLGALAKLSDGTVGLIQDVLFNDLDGQLVKKFEEQAKKIKVQALEKSIKELVTQGASLGAKILNIENQVEQNSGMVSLLKADIDLKQPTLEKAITDQQAKAKAEFTSLYTRIKGLTADKTGKELVLARFIQVVSMLLYFITIFGPIVEGINYLITKSTGEADLKLMAQNPQYKELKEKIEELRGKTETLKSFTEQLNKLKKGFEKAALDCEKDHTSKMSEFVKLVGQEAIDSANAKALAADKAKAFALAEVNDELADAAEYAAADEAERARLAREDELADDLYAAADYTVFVAQPQAPAPAPAQAQAQAEVQAEAQELEQALSLSLVEDEVQAEVQAQVQAPAPAPAEVQARSIWQTAVEVGRMFFGGWDV